jgi:hypothetical protein
MRHVLRVVKLGKAAGRRLRRWAVWVWRRVIDEPGYVEGLADLTLAVAQLLLRGNRSRRALVAATHAAVVIVRTIWCRNGEGDPQQLWV